MTFRMSDQIELKVKEKFKSFNKRLSDKTEYDENLMTSISFEHLIKDTKKCLKNVRGENIQAAFSKFAVDSTLNFDQFKDALSHLVRDTIAATEETKTTSTESNLYDEALKEISEIPTDIVINYYSDEDAKEPHNIELAEFLKEKGYEIQKDHVNMDETNYGNLLEKIENAKHIISVVTKKSYENFFSDEEYYQNWLRALHKMLNEDNILTHIIFCVGVEAESITWYLRQFNPCVEYESGEEGSDWKKELLKVLETEKKSVKTLEHVNAGEILAWSHYTGYVSFLPNLDQDKECKDGECVWKSKEGKPVINKLIMLAPKDGNCPDKIRHDIIGEPIESERYDFHRAGKKRGLSADLYKIPGIEKLVPIACTVSMETLHRLKEDKDKRLSDKWFDEQRTRYIKVLKDRMENDEYLARKVILIDDYDNENLIDIIRKKLDEGDSTAKVAPPLVVTKDPTIYIHSAEDETDRAKEVADALKEKRPDIKIVRKEDRIAGKLSTDETNTKICFADQIIFLLTGKAPIKKTMAADECLSKVLKQRNRRVTILLYTKEAKELNQAESIFKELAEDFVVHIVYNADGKWKDELIKAITDRQARPLKSAINYHNSGEGLAFGYLYGYLLTFLEELSDTMLRSVEFEKVKDVMPKKLIILMPKSGNSPRSLVKQKHDTNIKELSKADCRIGKVTRRVGCQKRDFSVTEYSLKDGDKEYFVAAEFLTPLATLKDMQEDIFADMTNKQKKEQQRNVRKVMLEIKRSNMIPKEIEDKFLLLEIEDEDQNMTDDDRLELYHRELLKTVKEELQRECK